VAIVIVICFTFINVCHGFLLDLTTTRIPPTSAPSSGDTHYNELMKLLRQEKKSRSLLETLVKQLQQELTTTKQEVALKQQMINEVNGTFEKQYTILKNSTKVLKDEHDLLQTDYDLLKMKHDRMEQNYPFMERQTNELEHDIILLKQNCSDNSHTVLTLGNTTKHIEQDLNNTNNDIYYLSKEVNATKQELFFLVNKVKATEDKLENRSVEIEAHQNMTSELFNSIDELTEQSMYIFSSIFEFYIFSSINTFLCHYTHQHQFMIDTVGEGYFMTIERITLQILSRGL
jgi:chromosome segregation ATPase